MDRSRYDASVQDALETTNRLQRQLMLNRISDLEKSNDILIEAVKAHQFALEELTKIVGVLDKRTR